MDGMAIPACAPDMLWLHATCAATVATGLVAKAKAARKASTKRMAM